MKKVCGFDAVGRERGGGKVLFGRRLPVIEVSCTSSGVPAQWGQINQNTPSTAQCYCSPAECPNNDPGDLNI